VQQDNAPSRPAPRPAPALAGRFLFLPAVPGDEDEPRWARAARWLPVWGLAIGIAYAVIFRLTWRVFGEYQRIRWVPVMAVLAVDLMVCGYRMLAGAASLTSLKSEKEGIAPPGLRGLVVVLLIVLGKFSLLAALPIGAWRSPPSGSWGGFLGQLGWLYPTAIYRPLILAPLWGRWAMSLAVTIGRTAPGESVRLQRMAGGSSLAIVVVGWLACAVLTAIYCSGSGEHVTRGVVLALAAMVIAYLTSFALALRAGGQTEATVGACGLVTEVTFLVCYVGVSNAIYWY
jgi:cobalamin synthase